MASGAGPGGCGAKHPTTWKAEDVELGVSCRKHSAKATFNLDNLNSLGCLKGLDVMLTYSNRTLGEQRTPLTNLNSKEFEFSDLESGSKYNFCLKFMADIDGHHGEVTGFCKVSVE